MPNFSDEIRNGISSLYGKCLKYKFCNGRIWNPPYDFHHKLTEYK